MEKIEIRNFKDLFYFLLLELFIWEILFIKYKFKNI